MTDMSIVATATSPIQSLREHNSKQVEVASDTMGTTISALELLSEESRKKVLNFTVELLNNNTDSPYRSLTEDAFYDDLDESLEQADRGETRDAFEALHDIKNALELKAEDMGILSNTRRVN